MTDLLERIENMPPKRLALLVLEMQSRLEKLERPDPSIAVIGLGCRFPQDADSPDRFWTLLAEGRDAVSEVPRDRWDVDGLFHTDPDAPGKIATRWGGFLKDVDRFDAPFFGVSRREAVSLDPQQRLALETSWHALEHAGIAPDSLRGSPVGVFLGMSTSDYYQILLQRGSEAIDAWLATGTAHSVAAGRIAYVLGLQGPNLAVDTACSSSLVAIHLACQSLILRECRMALAGGVNVLLSPEITIALSRSHMMAPDGRCKAFDSRADGFVRGEGCGIVVLKRLEDAVEAGDRILGVIRGSALNQDGRSSGITAPNGAAQEAVIRGALERAGIAGHQVDYVETHGTGTSLGDPIEAHALARTLAAGREPERPLTIGSVKTNVGHLESAAGVAGLMKVVLALENERIPAHLHFRSMNPHINWGGMSVRIPTSGQDWNRSDRRRIAGVSSFGFSGTNVHLIVEEAPAAAPRSKQTDVRRVEVLALSARTSTALQQLANRYDEHIAKNPATELSDICFTANTGRAALPERAVYVGATREGIVKDLAGGKPFATGRSDQQPKVAFLFSGQGAHYAGMGRQLYETEPVFRAAIEKCHDLLAGRLQFGIRDILYGNSTELLQNTQYGQPALFALQWALAELWRSWGVEPAVVLGHSAGEYAAGCVAGVFDLADGLKLIAERGRLMGSLPIGQGAMAALMAPAAKVQAAVQKIGGRVCVAAWNGPEHVVVSGCVRAIEQLQAQFAASGYRTERLRVEFAAHSAQLAPVEAAFESCAAQVRFAPPRLTFVSSLSGAAVGMTEVSGPRYWRRQLREPVAFASAIEAVAREGCTLFVEIGPGSTLLGIAQEAPFAAVGDYLWVPSIRRVREDCEQMAESLSQMYVRGAPVNWSGYYQGRRRARVALPTYPFERQRYWCEGPPSRRKQLPGVKGHPFITGRAPGALPVYDGRLDTASHPFLAEHRVAGQSLVPASIWIEAILSAAAATSPAFVGAALADFRLHRPLPIGDQPIDFQIVLTPDASRISQAGVQIYAWDQSDAGAWTLYASGRLEPSSIPKPSESFAQTTPASSSYNVEEYYNCLERQGIHLEERNRVVRSLLRAGDWTVAEIAVQDDAAGQFLIRPQLLDGCLQVLGAAAWMTANPATPCMLAEVGRFECVNTSPGQRLIIRARVTTNGDGGFIGEVQLCEPCGDVVATMSGVKLRSVASSARTDTCAPEDWFYSVHWQQCVLPKAEASASLAPDHVALESVREQVNRLNREEGYDSYPQLRPSLNRLVRIFAVQALESLGLAWSRGAQINALELQSRFGIVVRHTRLVRRLFQILVEDGVLAENMNGWNVLREPEREAWTNLAEKLRRDFPAFHAELDLTIRCGVQLADVLKGALDPIHLLVPDGSFETLDALYRKSPAARTWNPAVRSIAEAAANRAGRRPLRVLEIGAGTGATTSFVLPALDPRTVEYVFTDVSPAFVARAAEQFRPFEFVTFQHLDIESDAEQQALVAGGRFDIVIAANVLHATSDLRATVRRVHDFVAPGGVAVILEGTSRERWVDLTFGMTEGWWKFSDTELRPDHPLLSANQWSDLLADCGFENPTAVTANRSQQVLLVAPRSAARVSRWLIIDSAPGVDSSSLTNALQSAGRVCDHVTTAQLNSEHLCQHSYSEILHLADLSAAQNSVEDVCAHLLRTVHFAAGARGTTRSRLWVVTRGAQHIESAGIKGNISPASAALWGMVRSISLEHPELWGGIVDLDPTVSAASSAGMLSAWVQVAGPEDQAAIRRQVLYVPRLVRRPPPSVSNWTLRPDAAYLITGGLGNVGLELARAMVERGARRLILAGRNGLPDRSTWAKFSGHSRTAARIAAVRSLEDAGATVRIAVTDMGDADAVRRLISEECGDWQVAGVVHAAAVFGVTRTADMTDDELRSVLTPKAGGAWALHEATRMLPLEFFVLFSSTTGLLGSGGMAHYGAANQYIDALAQFRRASGLRALSIAWGTWELLGDTSQADRELYLRSGNQPMPAGVAIDALGRLLASGDAYGVVAHIDWKALRAVYEARRKRPLLEKLHKREALPSTGQVTRPASPASSARGSDLKETLQSVADSERLERTIGVVRTEAATVMGISADDVNTRTGLFEMGMDSLMSVELKRRLENRSGLELPHTLIFNYPDVRALAGYLLERLSPSREQAKAMAVRPIVERTVNIELSEDDIVDRLTEALRSLD